MLGNFVLFVAVGFAAQLVDGAIGMAYGRPSIPPEKLLRALLLQAFYFTPKELATRRGFLFWSDRSTADLVVVVILPAEAPPDQSPLPQWAAKADYGDVHAVRGRVLRVPAGAHTGEIGARK